MAAAVTTTSTTIESQIFEVANAMQALEYAIPEATRPNKVAIATDPEARTVTITVSLDATLTASGGTLTFAPVVYL